MPLWGKGKAANVQRDDRLVGRWDLDPTDRAAFAAYGNTTMVFEADGRLTYIIHESARDRLMLLTWRTDGEVVVSNQPSHPREERTTYRLLDDATLVLILEGQPARYLRVSVPVR